MRQVCVIRKSFCRTFFLVVITLGLSSTLAAALEFASQEKIKVVTTLFPLYDFVRAVGGDRVETTLLLPPGVEPHMYEPRPSDYSTINSADIFLYTSDTMEPWVARLLPAVTNQNLLIMSAANSIDLKGQDPHLWLNFANDRAIIDDIVDDLATVDEGGREAYRERGEAYKARLLELDRRYEAMLKDCRIRTIFYGGHAAFRQLAERYDLKLISPYAGFSPDAEPTPKAVAGLVSGMRLAGARTIFFEELMDPKIARVIAEEIGARQELLSAAHNVTEGELKNGVTFLGIMEDNLVKLRQALECR